MDDGLVRRQSLWALMAAWSFAAACSEEEAARAFYDDCGDAVGQSEECFVERREPSSAEVILAVEIADRWLEEHPPERVRWDWGEGVLMFSLTELYRVTGHERYREYAARWLELHIADGYDILWSDSCPPALTAIALHEQTGDDVYRQVVEDVLAYLDEAPRTPEGGIGHLGDLPSVEPTLWLDSLFMFGMVLTRWSEATGDEELPALFDEQLLIFADLLQHEGGLFLHAYNWPQSTETDIYWARGNGWVTAAGFDALRARRLRGEVPEDDDALRVMSAQASALLDAQDPATGLWWNILNRPDELYLETSASALFAFGLARGYRYGVLDESVLPTLELALEGLIAPIRRDEQGRPVVTGISGPTTAGDFEDYAEVELGEDRTFGVGSVILALIELSGLV